ncbi:hypothetical protein ACWDSJ_07865 [Nocardia sp. NPDC003482]|uniref:hypothetical protein n=1 Tax=Nocardia sp. NPDC004068 TaxID=3364303 RepID=UPI0036BF39DB
MFDTEFRRAGIDEDTQRMTVYPADGPDLEDFPAMSRAGAHLVRCATTEGRRVSR